MNRTQALCIALGWQGGTIHQVCEATGCSDEDILHTGVDGGQGYCRGYWLGHTGQHLANWLRTKMHGDRHWWVGLADGVIARNAGTTGELP